MKNQLGKLTNTPTLRLIFQCFQGVHLLIIERFQKVVSLTKERSLILEFYPLVVKNIISNALRVSNGAPHCPEDDSVKHR